MRSKIAYTRREFLAGAVAAWVAPTIIPARAFGANERIAIGHIGVGRRAQQLMTFPAEAVSAAASDVYLKRLEDLKQRNEKFKEAALYQDYREMLARSGIDGVIIATPDHWHALHAIHAMEAGKDVYVEKPMTLTIREGRRMVETARKHGRICQAGSQQRSQKANRIACEWVRNGRLGKVHTVHAANYPSPWECPLGEEPVPEGLDWDMWCGPTEVRPFHKELYLPRVRGQEAGWISYRPYSGGEVTGWGAHGLDQIQWALGMDASGPVEVEPLLDLEPPDDQVHKGPRCQVRLRYADGTEVILDDRGPGGGALFEGALGTLLIDRGRYEASPEVDTTPPDASGIHLYDSGAKTLNPVEDTEGHIGNWLYCMRTREMPVADVEIGHRSSTACHLVNIARWTRRKLAWNPVSEQFEGDEEANTYIDRARRAPWVL
ncbi:MAG: Gfo/Idh/MocA family oxidoreductase [Candidatus Hydrogenedentes bacterium]|nr:Gfo/Idh/MocA family oxidoreductase [Candidatus Hydrogenedentota bacterium]